MTLQLRLFAADPAGTRPSTPGSGFEPGPQRPSGVAVSGGSAGCWIGAVAGVSPVPWPMANRSLVGPDCA